MPMSTKLSWATWLPFHLSASQPPTGRKRLPTRGPSQA